MARLNRIWKLYIVFSFVIFVAMALTGYALNRLLEARLYSHLEQQVFTLARVLQNTLPQTDDPAVMTSWCEQYAELSHLRITVVDRDGKVLGDSHQRHIIGHSHRDRPEIEGAMVGGRATAVRFSETAKTELFYAALQVTENGGVIRLSLPMTQVKNIENEVMAFFVIALYLSPLIALVAAFFFAKQLADDHTLERKRI